MRVGGQHRLEVDRYGFMVSDCATQVNQVAHWVVLPSYGGFVSVD